MKDPIRITTATRLWRNLRRIFARSEWAVWLLGLKRNSAKATDPGLVMIQIDGLSRGEFEKAISKGHMPFTKSLLEREHYECQSMYSGLPSSTPAVQGELHYGVPTSVPAFGFRDHRTGRLVRMFANEIAADAEERLKRQNTGLLAGGSSYSNIYSGGAEEVHFCATSFGWNEFLNTLNPFQILLVGILNCWMLMRIVGLVALEFCSATVDFLRGIVSGRRFWQELIMIPARVVVVVLLRELVTIGTCFDTARGLPIIHLNLLGYDEQAHRRGPDSRFAHWSLKAIDGCIKRIWKSAHRGAGREYDIWVFSDHGQERTTPYEIENGKLVQQVVAEVVEEIVPQANESVDVLDPASVSDSKLKPTKANRVPTRADWIGLGWLVTMLFGEQDHDIQARSSLVQTVTSGPVGFVYLQTESGRCERDRIARKLVARDVPMCAYRDDQQQAVVITSKGKFQLPRDKHSVFGNHPFLEEVTKDLSCMVEHEDSGDILLIGWDGLKTTKSFVLQNGAHAGPGVDETSAFALLPSDTKLPITKRNYLRPNDLRLAALRFLGRDEHGDPVRRTKRRTAPVRVLSYNVHACVGMDGQLSPERIAKVIDQTDADVICLQELDVMRHRSGNRDQAHAIAQYLEMSHQFHPAWHLEEEQFGNAILTRLPMRVVQKKALHHHKEDRSRRSALWAEIDLDSQTSLQIINTHLSIYPQEQAIQARQLIEEWVQPASLLGPVVLCGDFNARPGSATHRLLCETLQDIESFDSRPTKRTLFSPFPISRVDHGLVSGALVCTRVKVVDSRLAKVASDHLPLLFDLKLSDTVDICKDASSGSGSEQLGFDAVEDQSSPFPLTHVFGGCQ